MDLPIMAMGEVAGWGKAIVHERGWRSQYVYPLSVSLLCRHCYRCKASVRPADVVVVAKGFVHDHRAMPYCRDHWADLKARFEAPVTWPAAVIEAALRDLYGCAPAVIPEGLKVHLGEPPKRPVLPRSARVESTIIAN